MVQVALVSAGFLAMLVFVAFALRFELDLGLVVASTLSVSIMATGLLVAAVSQYYLGLSMRYTALALALLVFLFALGYEAAG